MSPPIRIKFYSFFPILLFLGWNIINAKQTLNKALITIINLKTISHDLIRQNFIYLKNKKNLINNLDSKSFLTSKAIMTSKSTDHFSRSAIPLYQFYSELGADQPHAPRKNVNSLTSLSASRFAVSRFEHFSTDTHSFQNKKRTYFDLDETQFININRVNLVKNDWLDQVNLRNSQTKNSIRQLSFNSIDLKDFSSAFSSSALRRKVNKFNKENKSNMQNLVSRSATSSFAEQKLKKKNDTLVFSLGNEVSSDNGLETNLKMNKFRASQFSKRFQTDLLNLISSTKSKTYSEYSSIDKNFKIDTFDKLLFLNNLSIIIPSSLLSSSIIYPSKLSLLSPRFTEQKTIPVINVKVNLINENSSALRAEFNIPSTKILLKNFIKLNPKNSFYDDRHSFEEPLQEFFKFKTTFFYPVTTYSLSKLLSKTILINEKDLNYQLFLKNTDNNNLFKQSSIELNKGFFSTPNDISSDIVEDILTNTAKTNMTKIYHSSLSFSLTIQQKILYFLKKQNKFVPNIIKDPIKLQIENQNNIVEQDTIFADLAPSSDSEASRDGGNFELLTSFDKNDSDYILSNLETGKVIKKNFNEFNLFESKEVSYENMTQKDIIEKNKNPQNVNNQKIALSAELNKNFLNDKISNNFLEESELTATNFPHFNDTHSSIEEIRFSQFSNLNNLSTQREAAKRGANSSFYRIKDKSEPIYFGLAYNEFLPISLTLNGFYKTQISYQNTSHKNQFFSWDTKILKKFIDFGFEDSGFNSSLARDLVSFTFPTENSATKPDFFVEAKTQERDSTSTDELCYKTENSRGATNETRSSINKSRSDKDKPQSMSNDSPSEIFKPRSVAERAKNVNNEFKQKIHPFSSALRGKFDHENYSKRGASKRGANHVIKFQNKIKNTLTLNALDSILYWKLKLNNKKILKESSKINSTIKIPFAPLIQLTRLRNSLINLQDFNNFRDKVTFRSSFQDHRDKVSFRNIPDFIEFTNFNELYRFITDSKINKFRASQFSSQREANNSQNLILNSLIQNKHVCAQRVAEKNFGFYSIAHKLAIKENFFPFKYKDKNRYIFNQGFEVFKKKARSAELIQTSFNQGNFENLFIDPKMKTTQEFSTQKSKFLKENRKNSLDNSLQLPKKQVFEENPDFILNNQQEKKLLYLIDKNFYFSSSTRVLPYQLNWKPINFSTTLEEISSNIFPTSNNKILEENSLQTHEFQNDYQINTQFEKRFNFQENVQKNDELFNKISSIPIKKDQKFENEITLDSLDLNSREARSLNFNDKEIDNKTNKNNKNDKNDKSIQLRAPQNLKSNGKFRKHFNEIDILNAKLLALANSLVHRSDFLISKKYADILYFPFWKYEINNHMIFPFANNLFKFGERTIMNSEIKTYKKEKIQKTIKPIKQELLSYSYDSGLKSLNTAHNFDIPLSSSAHFMNSCLVDLKKQKKIVIQIKKLSKLFTEFLEINSDQNRKFLKFKNNESEFQKLNDKNNILIDLIETSKIPSDLTSSTLRTKITPKTLIPINESLLNDDLDSNFNKKLFQLRASQNYSNKINQKYLENNKNFIKFFFNKNLLQVRSQILVRKKRSEHGPQIKSEKEDVSLPTYFKKLVGQNSDTSLLEPSFLASTKDFQTLFQLIWILTWKTIYIIFFLHYLKEFILFLGTDYIINISKIFVTMNMADGNILNTIKNFNENQLQLTIQNTIDQKVNEQLTKTTFRKF